MPPLSLVIVVLLVAFFGTGWPRRRSVFQTPVYPPCRPEKYVIVDGSNVMHWGGEASLTILNTVLTALANRNLLAIGYFDANVGYKLRDRYANEYFLSKKTGIP